MKNWLLYQQKILGSFYKTALLTKITNKNDQPCDSQSFYDQNPSFWNLLRLKFLQWKIVKPKFWKMACHVQEKFCGFIFYKWPSTYKNKSRAKITNYMQHCHIRTIYQYLHAIRCSPDILHTTAVVAVIFTRWLSESEHSLVSACSSICHYLYLLVGGIRSDHSSISPPGNIGSRSTSGSAGEGPGHSIKCECEVSDIGCTYITRNKN